MGFDIPNMEDNQVVSDFEVINFLIPNMVNGRQALGTRFSGCTILAALGCITEKGLHLQPLFTLDRRTEY